MLFPASYDCPNRQCQDIDIGHNQGSNMLRQILFRVYLDSGAMGLQDPIVWIV